MKIYISIFLLLLSFEIQAQREIEVSFNLIPKVCIHKWQPFRLEIKVENKSSEGIIFQPPTFRCQGTTSISYREKRKGRFLPLNSETSEGIYSDCGDLIVHGQPLDSLAPFTSRTYERTFLFFEEIDTKGTFAPRPFFLNYQATSILENNKNYQVEVQYRKKQGERGISKSLPISIKYDEREKDIEKELDQLRFPPFMFATSLYSGEAAYYSIEAIDTVLMNTLLRKYPNSYYAPWMSYSLLMLRYNTGFEALNLKYKKKYEDSNENPFVQSKIIHEGVKEAIQSISSIKEGLEQLHRSTQDDDLKRVIVEKLTYFQVELEQRKVQLSYQSKN
jgi:hypothetical protein